MAGNAAAGDQSFPSSSPGSNLKKLLYDAHSRWLKPVEVCEILNSHHVLALSEASPIKPASGSLFLFDRGKLRYFRKDGHNWRKKKDGRTVREAHEKLKVGNRDAVHCYYAHGEENPNFHRRCYWLLEGLYQQITLVHYREVTEGSRYEACAPAFEVPMQSILTICGNNAEYYIPSQVLSPSEMGTSSYHSQGTVLSIERGDEFGGNQLAQGENSEASELPNTELDSVSNKINGYVSDLGVSGAHEMPHASKPMSCVGPASSDTAIHGVPWSQCEGPCQTSATRQNESLPGEGSYNSSLEANVEALDTSSWSSLLEGTYQDEDNSSNWTSFSQQQDSSAATNQEFETSTYQDNLTSTEAERYREQGGGLGEFSSLNNFENQQESGTAADLPSFSTKVGEVQISKNGLLSPTMSLIMRSIENDLEIFLSSSDPKASNIPGQTNPPLSQGRLFGIEDFAPEWSYAFEETKVLVSGTFLDSVRSNPHVRWSCVFGEIEVPADVLQSGALRCTAPPHKAGVVSFYVAFRDGIARSNVCKFEFRDKLSSTLMHSEATGDVKQQEEIMLLQVRLAELLLTREESASFQDGSNDSGIREEQNDNLDLLSVDKRTWTQIEALVKSNPHPCEEAKAMLVEAFFKSALHQWLQKTMNVCFRDKHGLGVLHMTAALGYEWAISPILSAGVGVNFRDERGWTALHWAAFCAREKVIALLLAADAAPGAITDPIPSDPTGRTASDLAALNGHNGIAGYLGEAIVTSHLSSLSLQESEMSKISVAVAGDQAIETLSVKSTFMDSTLGLSDYELSLRDGLAAVRNATQAEARITATFRAYSFLRKTQTQDSTLDEFGLFEEDTRAFAAAQTGQRVNPGHGKSNLAATQIQCKYRGWKARTCFLAYKRQVVKIQALVRGHQARKMYKIVLRTVGVLDKAVLRWRRKGSGLRGFKAENMEEEDSEDDTYLKDFRRQKEAMFKEAVGRVKMMIQDPKALSQYRRMLEINQKEKGAKVDEDLIITDDELMALLG